MEKVPLARKTAPVVGAGRKLAEFCSGVIAATTDPESGRSPPPCFRCGGHVISMIAAQVARALT
jgi:hypothetical protein